jgi:hypothetical protein
MKYASEMYVESLALVPLSRSLVHDVTRSCRFRAVLVVRDERNLLGTYFHIVAIGVGIVM